MTKGKGLRAHLYIAAMAFLPAIGILITFLLDPYYEECAAGCVTERMAPATSYLAAGAAFLLVFIFMEGIWLLLQARLSSRRRAR